jgi:hypothetical protein
MFRGLTKLLRSRWDSNVTIHVIGQRHSFISSDRIRDFHYEMFHGRATRNGVASPHHTYLSLHNAPQSPLQIVRNAFVIPSIFEPAENLVVSAAVHDELEGLPNISFQPVVFDRLYWLEYHAGDFSFYAPKEERPAQYRGLPRLVDRLPEKLPDAVLTRSEIGTYFEVVVASARTLRSDFQFLEPDVVLNDGRDAETRSVDVLPDLMDRYPLYNSRGLWIVEDALFHRLRAYFDWDYFDTASISM